MLNLKVPFNMAEIKRVRKQKTFAKKYYSSDFDEGGFGIGGSTFRAYRGFSKRPCDVYRSWAKIVLKKEKHLSLDTIKSRNAFLKFHKKLQFSLDRYWFQMQKKRLTIAQRNKMIDLFIKYIGRTRKLPSLIRFGNIPLDKYTLLLAKECFHGIIISPIPSMGNIETIETYDFLQDLIWLFMQKAKLPNLYFDYFAWNARHK